MGSLRNCVIDNPSMRTLRRVSDAIDAAAQSRRSLGDALPPGWMILHAIRDIGVRNTTDTPLLVEWLILHWSELAPSLQNAVQKMVKQIYPIIKDPEVKTLWGKILQFSVLSL